jgi:primosomal protein N'
MTHSQWLEDLQKLPHYREYTCSHCGHRQKAYVLEIQRDCDNCGTRAKLRGYVAIGTEIEDVIDAGLAWLATGEDLQRALQRKQELDQINGSS